jgi:hypothetical protein
VMHMVPNLEKNINWQLSFAWLFFFMPADLG